MPHLRLRVLAATLPFLLSAPPVFAQHPAPPTRAEAAAALDQPSDKFTLPQLDQMLAPIALYPDKLLATLLMAATFPPQVVDAGKWLQDPKNAALKGDDLVAALEPLPWEPSVKSLVPFPQIVAMMNDHLDWTEALGIAFANQQVETMARVQFLRDRALAAGKLKSTPQLAVSGSGANIVIEPVDANMVYMPVYNPAEAYGDWPDRDYPPVYLPPPPDYGGRAIGPGIGVAVGFGVVAPLWGWGHPDWRRHEVVVDRDRFTRITDRTNIVRNHTEIRNDTWRRTGPVAVAPAAARPPHPSPVPALRGTVPSTAVAHFGRDRNGGPEHRDRPQHRDQPAAGESPRPSPPAATTHEERHSGERGEGPRRDEAEHAPVSAPNEARPGRPHSEQHPAEARPPGPPHRDEAHAPPAGAAAPHPRAGHPGEEHRDEAHAPGPPHHEENHAAPAAAAAPPPSADHPGGEHRGGARREEGHHEGAPPHPPAPAAAAVHPEPAQAHPPGKPPEAKGGDKHDHKAGDQKAGDQKAGDRKAGDHDHDQH